MPSTMASAYALYISLESSRLKIGERARFGLIRRFLYICLVTHVTESGTLYSFDLRSIRRDTLFYSAATVMSRDDGL